MTISTYVWVKGLYLADFLFMLTYGLIYHPVLLSWHLWLKQVAEQHFISIQHLLTATIKLVAEQCLHILFSLPLFAGLFSTSTHELTATTKLIFLTQSTCAVSKLPSQDFIPFLQPEAKLVSKLFARLNNVSTWLNYFGGERPALAQSCSDFMRFSCCTRRRSRGLGGASGAAGSVKPTQLGRDLSDERQQAWLPSPSTRPFSVHH